MKPILSYISMWNAADRNAESGYAFSMRDQLSKRFHVVDLFPLGISEDRLWAPVRAAYKFAGRYYHPMREPVVLKYLASRIERHVREAKPQAIFSPSSVPLSLVDSAAPRIFTTDQLFCDFVQTPYTGIRQPAERFVRMGHAQEKTALSTAALATFPSQWAADSAVSRYGAAREKISVIPWGANLPSIPSQQEVERAIAQRSMRSCHLVFIGRQWARKGGELLVGTVQELNKAGLPARATIIGCEPPGLSPKLFDIHPYLNKGRPEHFATLSSLMLGAHFLFLPSRAEAYGQAFCEAAAFGLPSIGSTVGGIPTIIQDGETGFVRPLETSAAQFAAIILDTLSERSGYLRLARQAREDFLLRLNWDSFGNRLSDAIAAVM
ncbi:MAG TPA: glycosyltransferase family 4 protein [Rhizomicrobium sp.]|nr:glycosyltransferase family 4 protein [Rhizomicrobium sp.]